MIIRFFIFIYLFLYFFLLIILFFFFFFFFFFSRALRALNYSGPILALTGNSSQSDTQKALQNGYNHVLVKPIRPRDLLEIVTEWSVIKGPRGGRESRKEKKQN